MSKGAETQPATEPQEEAVPRTERLRNKFFSALAAGSLALLVATSFHGDAPLPRETLLQHNEQPIHDEDTITVMTANVHYWTGAYEIGKNYSTIMRVIDETDADVVCMQEFVDEGQKLESIHKAGYDVFFSTTVHWPWRDPMGNAIISKPALDNTATVSLPNPDTITPRNAIMGEIATTNGPLHITNTHLSSDEGEKVMQSELLLPHIEDWTDILCGDLKQLPDDLLAGPLSSLVNPAFLEKKSPTFPSKPNKPPVREVDYVVSYCGEPVAGTLEILDIDSDHFARFQEIDISGCHDSDQQMATYTNEWLEPASNKTLMMLAPLHD